MLTNATEKVKSVVYSIRAPRQNIKSSAIAVGAYVEEFLLFHRCLNACGHEYGDDG